MHEDNLAVRCFHTGNNTRICYDCKGIYTRKLDKPLWMCYEDKGRSLAVFEFNMR